MWTSAVLSRIISVPPADRFRVRAAKQRVGTRIPDFLRGLVHPKVAVSVSSGIAGKSLATFSLDPCR
jgi:hypothetical protein